MSVLFSLLLLTTTVPLILPWTSSWWWVEQNESSFWQYPFPSPSPCYVLKCCIVDRRRRRSGRKRQRVRIADDKRHIVSSWGYSTSISSASASGLLVCLLGDAWEIRFLFPSSASSVLSTYVYIGRHRHHLDKHRRADGQAGGPVIPFFVIIVQQQWIIGVENRSEFSSLAKSHSFMVHNESIYFVHSSKHPPALHS